MALNQALAVGFLDELFAKAPPGSHFHLWRKQGKYSHWMRTGDHSPVSDFLAPDMDYYVCPALFPSPMSGDKRGTEAQASGTVGFYLDIDFAHGVHKKAAHLPPDMDAAMSLLNALPAPCSAVVSSGHGIQAWVMLSEAFMFADQLDMARFKAVSIKWARTIQAAAAARGWKVDSTFDVVRLGRLPGSLNNKDSAPVPVELLGWTEKRYSIEELEKLSEAHATAPMAKPVDLSLDAEAMGEDVNVFFLEALCDANPNAAAVVAGVRQGTSDSESDMTIANMARNYFGQNGLEGADLENAIAHCVRANRINTGNKVEKASRASYVLKTVAAAMASREGYERVPVESNPARPVEGVPAGRETGEPGAPPLPEGGEGKNGEHVPVGRAGSSERAEADHAPEPAHGPKAAPVDRARIASALKTANFILGVFKGGITRVVRLVADEPEYILHFDNGATYTVGGIDKLMSVVAVGHAVADCLRVLAPPIKGQRVEQLREALLQAVEDEHIGEEATSAGQGRAWLGHFVASNPPADCFDPTGGSPCWVNESGRIMVLGPSLHTYVRMVLGEGGLGHKGFGKILRAAGCIPAQVRIRPKSGESSTRSAWVLPQEFNCRRPRAVKPREVPGDGREDAA